MAHEHVFSTQGTLSSRLGIGTCIFWKNLKFCFLPTWILNLNFYVYYLENLNIQESTETCVHCDLFKKSYFGKKNCQKMVSFSIFCYFCLLFTPLKNLLNLKKKNNLNIPIITLESFINNGCVINNFSHLK